MALTHRSDIVLALQSSGDLTVGSGTVIAYAPGGIVSTTASGLQTTIQLYSGHGFAINDRFLVGANASTHNAARKVTTSNATNIIIDVGLTNPTVGQVLINIGPDTGASVPAYTFSTITTYSGPSTAAPVNTNASVTLSSTGSFEYWHQASGIWELIRDTEGDPIGYNLDIIGSIFGTLSVTGAASVGSLVSSGAISGTTITASAGMVTTTMSASGAITGASLNVSSGAITGGAVSGTTGGFSGAITATGGVAGGTGSAKPYNIGTWPQPSSTWSGLTPSATVLYLGSLQVPGNCTVTGVTYMRGSAAAVAQKVIVALFDASGAVVANSNTAGTTVGVASTPQQVAFTAPLTVKGPAQYFAGLYFDTATSALFQVVSTAITNMGSGVISGGTSTPASVFGTVAAITPPTTFTDLRLPIMHLY